jgi:hypothetical protein
MDLEHFTDGALHANGMHFLATMIVAVVIWFLDVFEDYLVGLMLLLSWVVLDIVPSKMALADRFCRPEKRGLLLLCR